MALLPYHATFRTIPAQSLSALGRQFFFNTGQHSSPTCTQTWLHVCDKSEVSYGPNSGFYTKECENIAGGFDIKFVHPNDSVELAFYYFSVFCEDKAQH